MGSVQKEKTNGINIQMLKFTEGLIITLKI